jgi:hypothetical protein
MLGPGAECDLLLSGGQAGTLTASTTSGMTEIAAFPAYTASPPASSVVFAPKELDFGVQTAASPPAVKTVTLTNLGSASETLLAGILLSPESTSPFAPGASDCALGSPANTIQLAAGADCHISVDFTASASSLNDGFQQGALTIGAAQVLLTGYTQAATLSVSASEIDFGKEFQGGIILPRYLFLSNSSVSPVPHASVSLPQTSPFTVIDGCPAMLAAASNCRIEIDYESAAPPADDSATLTLDQGISVLLTGATEPPLDLGGSTVNPALNVSPSAITFGSGVAVTGVSTATQTVGITNAGDSAFSLSVALSGDFTSISSCPSTLAAGATCAVALQFAPSQPGNRQGLLAVTAGAGTPAVDVALSGTGTPILAANNGVLAAGAVPVGQPLVQFFKITQPFASLAASVTGPFRVTLIEDAGFGPGNPPSSDFVPSGEGSCHNCWVAVRFQPVAAGAQNGALTLASTPQGLPYVLQLVGSGLATSGLIVTPSVQDFGAIPLHSESGAVIFSLTNEVSGGAAITVSAPSASGAFQLPSLPGGGSPCAGSLAFGATCSLAVAFAPTSVGPQTGSLTLTTSAGTASASLSGTGTPDPGVAIAPLALNFVNGAGGSATVQNVVITNTGPVTVQVGPSTHADPHFIATTNCGALPPAASCSIRAEFVPAATLASDTLLIPVTAPGSNGTPQTSIYPVTLTGSYTSGGAELGISPAMVNFGPTAVATLGQLRQFTVSNLTAQALQLSTSLPRNYSLAGAPCTSLAANGSCSLQVQFVPLTNGDLPGTMTILGAPADGSTALSSVAYAEGFGVGTGALTLSGGLIVEGIYNFGQVAAGQTATNTFTAQNNGPSGSPPITVRRVTSAPPFFSTTNCGLPLAVGKSCTVAVTYTPAGPSTMGSAGSSADQGSLIIQSDAQSSPDTVNLLGQSGPGSGVTALNVLSMTRSSLTFPATSVGDSSPAQSVTLTNSGNIPIQVTSAFATPDFTVQSGCNTLSAGAECTIQVASTPQSPGIHLAALEISSNAGTSLEYVSLVGTGTAAPLSLSPVALDFGSVQVGSSASLPVTASNSGSAPITFTSISATGDFSTLGNCPASGSSLAAESSCTVQVTFAPSAPGLRSGTLAFTTSASSAPLEVSLSGIGTQSQLVVTPASLSFGPILVGAAANLSLMLVNSGSASLRGLSFVADGDFSVTGPCPQTALSPGASCNLQIGFSPSATGTRTGTLSIASSSPGTPTLVPLTGTGISNATFKLSVNGGTSASLTVVSGQFGTFALLVTPAGGFGGNVALTCTPVQTVEFASCALQPPLVSLGSGAQSSMASINTIDKGSPIATVLSPPVASPDRTFLALALPGVLLLLRRGRTPRRWLGQGLAVAAILLILTASGCGGGSNIHFTPPGTYQFVVTANSTSGAQVTQTVTLNLQVTPR